MHKKTIWEPTKVLTWLGIEINLNLGVLKITPERISNILKTANFLLSNKYLSARKLSKFTGKIISTKYVLGDLVLLKTKFLYKVIESRAYWDSKINVKLYSDMLDEILFWKNNVIKFNLKRLIHILFLLL